ncbi:MAG TPA: ribonuclease HII [Candidatus Hydrogenedentes bacterium]|nr:ribonuclease HII [Candidatus Hydrogenedentota bacterium]
MVSETLDDLREAVAAGPPFDQELLAALQQDRRAGARALYERCLLLQAGAETEDRRLESMLAFERAAQASGFSRIAGVDEAGRGPLAGPIVAAAVVLAEPVPGLNDSKQLTAERRETLFNVLQDGDHDIGVAAIDAAEIDRIGIQAANYGAMAQAVATLKKAPDFLLVDGFALPGVVQPQQRLIKGDSRSLSIAAASIIAKVTRDRMMNALDRDYPEFGFGKHKGYATSEHLAVLAQCGPCPVHRKSFAPIAKAVETIPMF